MSSPAGAIQLPHPLQEAENDAHTQATALPKPQEQPLAGSNSPKKQDLGASWLQPQPSHPSGPAEPFWPC